MREAYATMAGSQKSGGDEMCTVFPERCTVSPLQAAITDLIKMQNPRKAWVFVANLFGLKERAAKHRLANARCYSIEELQLLIQGEDGLQYLEALMADAEPQWWTWARWTIEQGALKRLAVEATQKSLQLEAHLPVRPLRSKSNTHVKKLGAELSRSQTTIGLLDSYSSRSSARSMAEASGKGTATAVRTSGGRGR